nr:ribosome biogenesis factor YjgA [Desulfosarcina cetonica]
MRSHGARRRQMQYVGTLMRSVDVEPIEQALMDIEQGAYRQTQAFHRLEAWRDRLIDGDDALMAEILEDYPDADRQRLSQLVRNARKERGKEDAPARSARHLFRYLQGIMKT